jgi:hypothetical protein
MYKQADLIFNPEQKHIQYSKQSEYGNVEWAAWRQGFNKWVTTTTTTTTTTTMTTTTTTTTTLMHLSHTIW